LPFSAKISAPIGDGDDSGLGGDIWNVFKTTGVYMIYFFAGAMVVCMIQQFVIGRMVQLYTYSVETMEVKH